MSHAPREESQVDRTLDNLIANPTEIDAFEDIFCVAVESGTTGEEKRQWMVEAIAAATTHVSSAEELAAPSVFPELMPLPMVPELHTIILEVLMAGAHLKDKL